MKIAFITTQSFLQSTLIGRIMPIGEELVNMGNDVTVLVHEEQGLSFRPPSRDSETTWIPGQARNDTVVSSLGIKTIGKNPFTRTKDGKKRKRGVGLIWVLLKNAISAAMSLIRIRPDVIIIVKPLPENTFAVMLAKIFLRNVRVVLDVDDFELFANVISSLPERAVLHWSERNASKMAGHIITATPFLTDHMRAIAQKDVASTLIPTGLSIDALPTPNGKKTNATITYIGSISQSSGHLVYMLPEILEHVRKEIPDANMLIAGSGDDEQALKQLFTEKNIEDHVEWFGRFSDSDIPEIISRTSIIIDPIDDSIVNRAKSSFRAMLACASGRPIITSNIGIRPIIIPAILHAKYFATPGDIQEYADRIIALFHFPITAEEVLLLQEQAKKYSYQQLAELYYNCLL